MRSCRVSPRLLPLYLAQWSLFFHHLPLSIPRPVPFIASILLSIRSRLSQRENFNNSRIWYYVASFVIPNFPNRRKSSNECLYTQGLRVTRSVDTILLPFHEDNNVSLDVYVLLDADRSKKDRRVPVVKFSNMLANFGSNESILGYLASKGRCSKRYPISDVWDLRRKDERPATE